MPVTFADVAKSEYILLTTFTKDGRPKPTAIWAAQQGDRLVVITQEKSWKVKRIRNTPRVTIAPCDRSGNPKGEAVEAIAAILDKSANGATYDAIGSALRVARQDVQRFLQAARGNEEQHDDRTEAGVIVAPTFDEIAKARYILLTTFTKDGKPKPTAIWAAPDGDRLLVITEDNSWKVKRIRNTPRVTLAICDPRGNPKSEPIEAVARVLDKSEAPDVRHAINKRYGVLGWLFGVYIKLRGLDKKSVGVELTAA